MKNGLYGNSIRMPFLPMSPERCQPSLSVFVFWDERDTMGIRNFDMKEQPKGFIQFLKFSLVSCGVTILQLVLVNAFVWIMKDWKQPLPGFLLSVFSESVVGKGNQNFGYVMPFFLSNLAANLYGYLQNKKTTFHSGAPAYNMVIFAGVVSVLILFSTWFQGWMVHYITVHIPGLQSLAPTIAALMAGMIQFAVLFPLEKYVLLKEERGSEND